MKLFKEIFDKILNCEPVSQFFRKYYTGSPVPEIYPRGHYYSPLPDIETVIKDDQLFNQAVKKESSINIRRKEQLQLLEELQKYYSDFNWEENGDLEYRFNLGQYWFCHADALILYSLMRYFKPKKIIEVGSGYSSALMLDVSERFLNNDIDFTFIEPFPERLNELLKPVDYNTCSVINKNVQSIPVETFEKLEANDILFIDSSHISKIGSDVNYIMFEILPVLKSGVLVHFHDIFWCFEYPKEWIEIGHAWNESYILRAFLQYNDKFQILLFNDYIGRNEIKYLIKKMPKFLINTGGSIWLKKVDGNK